MAEEKACYEVVVPEFKLEKRRRLSYLIVKIHGDCLNCKRRRNCKLPRLVAAGRVLKPLHPASAAHSDDALGVIPSRSSAGMRKALKR